MTRRPRLPEPEPEVVDCKVELDYLGKTYECIKNTPHEIHRVVTDTGTSVQWTEEA